MFNEGLTVSPNFNLFFSIFVDDVFKLCLCEPSKIWSPPIFLLILFIIGNQICIKLEFGIFELLSLCQPYEYL